MEVVYEIGQKFKCVIVKPLEARNTYQVLIRQENLSGVLICLAPLSEGEELTVSFSGISDGKYCFFPHESDFNQRMALKEVRKPMGHFARLTVEAWSHWYVRLGVASSTLLLLLMFLVISGSSGPTAAVHFIPRQRWNDIDQLPRFSQIQEINRLNGLFENDDQLRSQSKKFGALVNLLGALDSIPSIICIGIMIAGSGFLADIAYRKIARRSTLETLPGASAHQCSAHRQENQKPTGMP